MSHSQSFKTSNQIPVLSPRILHTGTGVEITEIGSTDEEGDSNPEVTKWTGGINHNPDMNNDDSDSSWQDELYSSEYDSEGQET